MTYFNMNWRTTGSILIYYYWTNHHSTTLAIKLRSVINKAVHQHHVTRQPAEKLLYFHLNYTPIAGYQIRYGADMP